MIIKLACIWNRRLAVVSESEIEYLESSFPYDIFLSPFVYHRKNIVNDKKLDSNT